MGRFTLWELVTIPLVLGSLWAIANETAALAEDNGASPAATESAAGDVPAQLDFNLHVRPIFNAHCVACHGGVKQASNLSLLRRASALAEAESGEIPIVPGDTAKSQLISRITAGDDERMPPADHGPALSAREIAILRRWIEQGATWKEHWAYVAPVAVPLPAVSNDAWCRQPFDRHVLARLDAEKLKPAPEADRRAWLRRVSFDLTGLPPTLEETKAFLDDESPQAYEKVVDRLLASPAYGERWAAVWLDLARYADTMGFERDPGRTIWPYRDWLIRAFNDDMPYDQFTIKQLAGDLVENATLDDLVATAFHRNTQNNTEGGTDDEEFRVQAVIDRVNTTWQVFQATTFGCTQCHSHPYSPFDNAEYYQFMALLNNTQDADLNQEYPLASVPLGEQDRAAAQDMDRRIAELKQSQHARLSAALAENDTWRNLLLDKAEATNDVKLKLESRDGASEVATVGTISVRPKYTLEGPAPAEAKRLTALRIEVMPTDLEAALRVPEAGFVLSRLEASVISPGAKEPKPIEFLTVLGDDPQAFLDPEASLHSNPEGFSAYSRIWQTRWAVFVPKAAVELKPGDRLQIVLSHEMNVDGSREMVVRRARFSISDDEGWQQAIDDKAFVADRSELSGLKKKRGKLESVSVPITRDMPAEVGRKTYLFDRGNWLNRTQEVRPDTPKLLPPLPEGTAHDRLAMARWLVSSANPLAARVMVNRLWTELFGIGIVETAEDFGPAGIPPSNQALLDHLAIRFQKDHGWSIKRILREIALSATYRQDSKTPAELRERDPQNKLLARGPRARLSAEMVRDQALAASGLLSKKMYGAPVMPPQPDGVWRSAYNGGTWKTAEGEDRYRRGLYTYWKRTSGYPSFMAFDCPSREVCTPRRIVTNTPLQALTVLNDEAHIECARALAKRMMHETGPVIRANVQWAYALVTSEEPAPGTVDDLAALYDKALAVYQSNPEQSKKLGDTPELAARTLVANAILNLDNALAK